MRRRRQIGDAHGFHHNAALSAGADMEVAMSQHFQPHDAQGRIRRPPFRMAVPAPMRKSRVPLPPDLC